MSTISYAIQDSATMLRRNLRRTLRYPASAAATVGIPIVFLLLFVFVFGDTLGAGLAGVSGGRDEYLDNAFFKDEFGAWTQTNSKQDVKIMRVPA